MTSARAVIRRLRAGIVPAAEIERLSIGYRGVQAAVAEHLVVLTEGKRPPAIFVRGEWGTGKTHLLTYITKATAAHGLASSKIDLNARSAPLGHPQRFYTQLMSNLATAGERGLRQILTSALKDPAKRHRIVEFARSGQAADLAPSLTDLCFVFSRDEHAAFGNEPP
ncbi:MAG: DUF2791 family P-loop domain-containing protein [Betaproteobacteria bacterium]|nr:DUF2791 family P-loop domain-containing protein [Betaproteobacteria bacterium]